MPMKIDSLIESLRADLARSAQVGGKDVADAAERLLLALEPALRLTLMDALTQAAEEIRARLPGVAIDVRLNGREPEFVVEPAHMGPSAETPVEGDEGVVRITLRLPEALKTRAEALAARRGQSLNTRLVAAARAAAGSNEPNRHGPGQRNKGWAR
jgi:hypothetical protein